MRGGHARPGRRGEHNVLNVEGERKRSLFLSVLNQPSGGGQQERNAEFSCAKVQNISVNIIVISAAGTIESRPYNLNACGGDACINLTSALGREQSHTAYYQGLETDYYHASAVPYGATSGSV